eukprot:CAMPEP_0115053488 /NCGR_PEP_ID=MMETSP0227-20121206/3542_1 /TAXON_ID=89957 /ORGANISM="Polarella glacialis, Strain CCMP 1383" /LENGTH=78 /DNA_ID=CAMNT_0002437809 /DNA_START=460 /DNA_END=697 /DNA_ORIENTATION=+
MQLLDVHADGVQLQMLALLQLGLQILAASIAGILSIDVDFAGRMPPFWPPGKQMVSAAATQCIILSTLDRAAPQMPAK